MEGGTWLHAIKQDHVDLTILRGSTSGAIVTEREPIDSTRVSPSTRDTVVSNDQTSAVNSTANSTVAIAVNFPYPAPNLLPMSLTTGPCCVVIGMGVCARVQQLAQNTTTQTLRHFVSSPLARTPSDHTRRFNHTPRRNIYLTTNLLPRSREYMLGSL